MKLDKLFGSLQTLELHFGEGRSKRKTGIALTSMKEEVIEESKVSGNEESLAKSIVLLTKQVAKIKSQFHNHVGGQRSSRDSSSTRHPKRSSSFSSFRLYRRKDHERDEKDYGCSKFEKNSKGIRCHEFEGFVHIQTECSTYLKRKKKSLVVTLSDDDDYSESDEEEVRRALISISTTKEGAMENVNDHQQRSISNEPLSESTLKRKWEKDRVTIAHQQDRIQYLMKENQSFLLPITTFKAELKEARNQFDELLKSIKMLTNGTHKLDELLDQGKKCNDKRGLGFSERRSDRNENKTVVCW
ncbi:gag-pol polyprotein [Cucumis melo var. makuwa]|uniref:Gag-pol polyprotein n=1 Tax=Cucumis melo var. makuwa TaxID=1194695 RepID=A0A5A7UFY2_CUCMM|nr:gag-pol polyprotein [Cucumis melo var. makuwa]TYK29404.1 gag-pol polyprotein [Cucumis melo var. makuwa]